MNIKIARRNDSFSSPFADLLTAASDAVVTEVAWVAIDSPATKSPLWIELASPDPQLPQLSHPPRL